MRIQFARHKCMFDPITMNGRHRKLVKSAIVLGLALLDNLTWIEHIRMVVAKLLKQLWRADVKEKHLIEFYNACIQSVLEYACEVFHSNLPAYLSDDLERVQQRAMRIIFPATDASRITLREARIFMYKAF